METQDLQFYPTPKALAERAWAKFDSQHVSMLLEPSAGNGAMLDAMPFWADRQRCHRGTRFDAIEFDMQHHASLRSKNARIVGVDFLQFEQGMRYSHILMNPPFNAGAAHVLHAWKILFDGEIVAIVNAETVRNPFSAERQHLVKLIDKHGSVEFICEAFAGADAKRTTDVEVALIHLTKKGDTSAWMGRMLEDLDRSVQPTSSDPNMVPPTELALPSNFVQTQVRAYKLALVAAEAACKAEIVASRAFARIGKTNDTLTGAVGEAAGDDYARAYVARLDEAKDRAWASILHAADVIKDLPQAVQREAQRRFEEIKLYEFTETNVWAFLLGLVEARPQMQIDGACEVFDMITRYGRDNEVHFRGWKSNDKHRTLGRRIKMSRFILPGFTVGSYSRSVGWEADQVLADIDRVFAMLDGKAKCTNGLVQVVTRELSRLCDGERVVSDYFEVRLYPKAGTIHFFPRDKAIIDRLNRLVGRHRQWLPPQDEQASKTFWKAYDQAEKLDEEFRSTLTARNRTRSHSSIFWALAQRSDCSEYRQASDLASQAMQEVLERHGLLDAIEDQSQAAPAANHDGQFLLLAA